MAMRVWKYRALESGAVMVVSNGSAMPEKAWREWNGENMKVSVGIRKEDVEGGITGGKILDVIEVEKVSKKGKAYKSYEMKLDAEMGIPVTVPLFSSDLVKFVRAFGTDETSEWVGRLVRLEVQTHEFNGKQFSQVVAVPAAGIKKK